MTMRPVLPRVHGQTVLSLVENDSRFTGRPLTTRLSHLTSRRGPLCSSTMPCRGQALEDVFEGDYGAGPALVLSASAAPLYITGMSPEQARNLVDQLATGARSRTVAPRFSPGLQCGNRVDIQCPECVCEAERLYGFTVGLVWHAFDFVTRCPVHESSLRNGGTRSLLEVELNNVRTRGARENSLRFAQRVRDILQPGSQRPPWARILGQLESHGFLTQEGRVRLVPLDQAFKRFYSDGFEDVRQDWLVKNVSVAEVCVRAAARGRAIHPVLLILLEEMAANVDSVVRQRSFHLVPDIAFKADAEAVMAHRAQWGAHLAANPGLTRTQLRRTATATWAWLSRNDRTWLLANQVSATKPPGGRPPAQLPGPLLDAIRCNTTDLRYSAEGREPLPSAYQERLGFGMTEYTYDRVARTLNESTAHRQLPANRQVFVTRRVARATADPACGGTQALSVIARVARLRPETLVDFYQPT